MYQVNAAFKDVNLRRLERGAIARFFGAPEFEKTETGGTVQFTAGSIGEAISKLQYLVSDVSTVTDLSMKKI